MTNTWANNDWIGSGDAFAAVHSGLTVQLVATPRDQLFTCGVGEPASDVVSANTESYDFIPVTDDSVKEERIIGLFHAADFSEKAIATGRVRDHLIPLAEESLIGADASILDFVIDADTNPCRLVLAGPRISGHVSISDLQKLPVRAALFALITGFEMVMVEAIRSLYPATDDWLSQLSSGRRDSLRQEIQKSKKADGYVDSLLFTQFCDKADIIRKSLSFDQSKGSVRTQLSEIQKLRDGLAHANEYAASPGEARHVCAVVRSILALRDEIANAAQEIVVADSTSGDRRAVG